MLTGGLIPFLGLVITPCDEHGQPSSGESAATDRFETRCVLLAWFGFCGMWAYGAVSPRKVDPNNPKAYAPGDMRDTFV